MHGIPDRAATSEANPEPGDTRALSIGAAVKAAYQREFGRTIEHPAINNNPQAVNCRGEGHLTTTAYLKTAVGMTSLSMYMSRDGTSVIKKAESPVLLPPAGVIRVLAVLVTYPETIAADALARWESAQNHINEDHATSAKSRGYNGPIVAFENTNIVVDPSEMSNPRSSVSARSAARRRGVATADYQIIMTIDLNPQQREGGFSVPKERSVYVGNYASWKTPLTGPQWEMIARTAYHHEVAHHWGWPGTHDWAGSCGGRKPEYAPFIVPPVLLGWEDLDGDRQADIFRKTSP